MADLQRIQNCIDQIPNLIQKVQDLKSVFPRKATVIHTEPSYLAEDIQDLKKELDTWKEVTAAILTQEVGEADPYLGSYV